MSGSDTLFPNIETANTYVESVREHYREGHAEYRGRRTPDQQLIAEVTADEARLILDGVAAVVIGLASSGKTTEVPSEEQESEPITGGYSWAKFRGEFERLLVGFGVITNRLNRDGYDVPSYADLRAEDRIMAASVLLGDFLTHNALRFGTDSVGNPRSIHKRVHTEDGGIEDVVHIVDADRARNDREIQRNIATRSFTSGVATHPAGKISPADYRRLRKEYPEVDKDRFDYAISFCTDVFKFLEEQE